MKKFSIRYALYCLAAVSICNNASFSMNGNNDIINDNIKRNKIIEESKNNIGTQQSWFSWITSPFSNWRNSNYNEEKNETIEESNNNKELEQSWFSWITSPFSNWRNSNYNEEKNETIEESNNNKELEQSMLYKVFNTGMMIFYTTNVLCSIFTKFNKTNILSILIGPCENEQSMCSKEFNEFEQSMLSKAFDIGISFLYVSTWSYVKYNDIKYSATSMDLHENNEPEQCWLSKKFNWIKLPSTWFYCNRNNTNNDNNAIRSPIKGNNNLLFQ